MKITDISEEARIEDSENRDKWRGVSESPKRTVKAGKKKNKKIK